MKIDFDSVDDVADYVTVPAGTYLCKVAEVQTGVTRDGDVRWGLRLVVAEGEFVGRQAAWDNLVFSPRGTARVRMILRALRLPTQGTVNVQPEDLIERSAFVVIEPEQFRAPATGRVIRRNRVPFEGYRAVEDYEDPDRRRAHVDRGVDPERGPAEERGSELDGSRRSGSQQGGAGRDEARETAVDGDGEDDDSEPGDGDAGKGGEGERRGAPVDGFTDREHSPGSGRERDSNGVARSGSGGRNSGATFDSLPF